MAGRHHLPCEACERQKDFVSRARDTPREREVEMKSRKARLEHAFVLPMPIEGALGPVLVAIKYVWHYV
jgi:hypothetical protein